MATQSERLENVRAAIARGEVTHSRARRVGGPVICVYKRDHESPTGCTLLHILDDNAATAEVLRGCLSPLSPTEGF